MLIRVIPWGRNHPARGSVCHVKEEVDETQRQHYRRACHRLPLYGEHKGKWYCVLHFPSETKKEDFQTALENKLKQEDYYFASVFFPTDTTWFKGFEFNADVSFEAATFCGVADFWEAKFHGEYTAFSGTEFGGEHTLFAYAEFSGTSTDFSGAKFSSAGRTIFSFAKFLTRAGFLQAEFGGEYTDFSNTEFSGEEATFWGAKFDAGVYTEFVGAEFGGMTTDFTTAAFSRPETYFQNTTFRSTKVDFSEAAFKERVAFVGRENAVFTTESRIKFDNCRIDKPELFTFTNVLLRPYWFINVDARQFNFTDVEWYGLLNASEGKLEEEIELLEKKSDGSPYALLSQACRRLSANAEENREYPLANEFHFWSMDALRKEGWRRLGLIGTLYWALSGYGVRAARALLMLVGICVAFAGLYMLLGPDALRVSSASSIGQALEHGGQTVVYSLSTLARLNPEPKPNPGLFQLLVTIEGILGPLQIALLALAVRRKVMR